jgi:hypothetical protein
MKTALIAALLASTWVAPSALASSRGGGVSLHSAEKAVKADAVAHGLVGPNKIVLTGESFTILSKTARQTAKPIERVMASGTIDRSTGRVTSFNPILMD